MNKKEILSIVNNPSKHIQIVNLDGEASIAYSAKFVELLELIPEMYTKADVIAMLEDLDLQIDESAAYSLEVAKVQRLIRDKIDELRGEKNE